MGMRRSIIIVNHYAGSISMGMEYRAYYLANEWKKMGYDVCIISGSYSHLRIRNPKVQKNLSFKEIDGVKYCWIKTIKYSRNNYKRLFSIMQFCLKLFVFAGRVSTYLNPAVVIASSTYPFDIYPARKIAKKTNAKLIHELHDMWPLSLIELGGMSPHNPFVKMVQVAENHIYRVVDAEVSILSNTKEYMVQHGLDPEKYYHIPNGIKADELLNKSSLTPDIKDTLIKLHTEGFFICCFFGSHTKSYGLDALLDAKKELDKVALVFVGKGVGKEELINKTKKENIQHVYFFDPIPKNEIHSLLDSVDCVYIGTNGSPLFRYGLSMNKLYDAMYSAKPIILAADSPNNLVDVSLCGISISSVESREIVVALEQLSSLGKSELEAMGQKGREYVLSNCDYSKIAEEFASIF